MESRNGQHRCLICGREGGWTQVCRPSVGSIVCCTGCGLVRTWPPRSAEELSRLHNVETYFSHPYFTARRQDTRGRHAERLRAVLRRLARDSETKGFRLLDVGCDTGTLLRIARDELGMEVCGVEVSGKAARIACKEHALDVRVGDIAACDLPAESFDFVTLIDVVEHTADPGTVLVGVNRLLRKGGRVMIITLDHDALIYRAGLAVSRLMGRAGRSLLDRLYIPQHEFYFNRSTLAWLLRHHGFKVLSHEHREFPLDEFEHGRLMKTALGVAFVLQWMIGRSTLQDVLAVRQ